MSCKILIVEDDSNIAKYIQACLTMGGYDSEICSDGLSAVERACGLAQPGDVVIMSPASASFDRFKNFEERGNVFKNLVNALK